MRTPRDRAKDGRYLQAWLNGTKVQDMALWLGAAAFVFVLWKTPFPMVVEGPIFGYAIDAVAVLVTGILAFLGFAVGLMVGFLLHSGVEKLAYACGFLLGLPESMRKEQKIQDDAAKQKQAEAERLKQTETRRMEKQEELKKQTAEKREAARRRKAREREAYSMKLEGMSDDDVADRLGVEVETVPCLCDAEKLRLQKAIAKKWEKEIYARKCQYQTSDEVLASELGIDVATVRLGYERALRKLSQEVQKLGRERDMREKERILREKDRAWEAQQDLQRCPACNGTGKIVLPGGQRTEMVQRPDPFTGEPHVVQQTYYVKPSERRCSDCNGTGKRS